MAHKKSKGRTNTTTTKAEATRTTTTEDNQRRYRHQEQQATSETHKATAATRGPLTARDQGQPAILPGRRLSTPAKARDSQLKVSERLHTHQYNRHRNKPQHYHKRRTDRAPSLSPRSKQCSNRGLESHSNRAQP